MTRLALLSDTHGNAVALDAVLADLAGHDVDGVVCLGDVAATGPQPRETVERLRALGCPVVMGNADAWMLDPVPDPQADDNARRFEEMDLWCAEQLGPDLLAWLGTFQPTVEAPLDDNASLLCYHGSPRSFHDIIRPTTPDAELEPMLRGVGATATLLAGGHTHQRMLRLYEGRTLLNPGSVGLPSDPPWAEYAIVEVSDGVERVTFQRVRFDVARLHAAAREARMPHAEWWIGLW